MSKHELIQALKRNQSNQKDVVITAKVLSVDEDSGTCRVESISDSLLYDDILLSMGIGFQPIPKVDSIVALMFLDKSEATGCLVSWTELDGLLIKIGEKEHRFDKNGITLNGGEKGSLILIDKLCNKINDLETRVNELTTLLISHTHTSTAPASPTSPPTPPILLTPLIPTQAIELENKEIIQ